MRSIPCLSTAAAFASFALLISINIGNTNDVASGLELMFTEFVPRFGSWYSGSLFEEFEVSMAPGRILAVRHQRSQPRSLNCRPFFGYKVDEPSFILCVISKKTVSPQIRINSTYSFLRRNEVGLHQRIVQLLTVTRL